MTAAAHATMLPPRRTLRDIVAELLARLEETGGEVTDAIDGLELELEDKIEACHVVLMQLESEADSCAVLEEHYATKKKAKKRNADDLRERLLTAMKAAGKKSVKTPTVTAYLQPSTSVEVADDFCDHAADRFVRGKSEPKLKEIRAALEAKEAVEGARLVQSVGLRFR
jgi:hypothetical protein